MYNKKGNNAEYYQKNIEEKEEPQKNNNTNSFTGHLDDFLKMAKNVDVDKVQEGITSLQKTLTLFGDLFVNKNSPNTREGYNPRPLYRRFED